MLNSTVAISVVWELSSKVAPYLYLPLPLPLSIFSCLKVRASSSHGGAGFIDGTDSGLTFNDLWLGDPIGSAIDPDLYTGLRDACARNCVSL